MKSRVDASLAAAQQLDCGLKGAADGGQQGGVSAEYGVRVVIGEIDSVAVLRTCCFAERWQEMPEYGEFLGNVSHRQVAEDAIRRYSAADGNGHDALSAPQSVIRSMTAFRSDLAGVAKFRIFDVDICSDELCRIAGCNARRPAHVDVARAAGEDDRQDKHGACRRTRFGCHS